MALTGVLKDTWIMKAICRENWEMSLVKDWVVFCNLKKPLIDKIMRKSANCKGDL